MSLIAVSNSPAVAALIREMLALEQKADNHDAMSAEYDRLRTSLASADRLDCDVDEIEDIAEAMRKQSDEHHDMRTDVATALGCSDSTDDIIAAVRDRAAELTDARESQRIAEAAMVKLARRVEWLESQLHQTRDRGLFDRLFGRRRTIAEFTPYERIELAAKLKGEVERERLDAEIRKSHGKVTA